jgi:hypothetical protein
VHAQQASTAIKQEGLEEACDKLIGPRRSAREIKKGHGSTKNDCSVVLPTRVLAQSQGHTSAIDARNSSRSSQNESVNKATNQILPREEMAIVWSKLKHLQSKIGRASTAQVHQKHHNDAAHFVL